MIIKHSINGLMKKVRTSRNLYLFLTTAFLFQSCDKKEEVINKPTLYIVTQGPKEISTYGGAVPVEFLCNLDWTVTSDVSWVSFANGTTGSQSGVLQAAVEKNESGADRFATITMTAGNLSKKLQINQKYRDTSTPQLNITSTNPINTDFESGSKLITFTCNVTWNATSNVDWITFEGATSGLEDGTVKVVLKKNEGTASRTGIISITAGTEVKTIQIVQKSEALAGTNLLDTPEEDYSFERIKTNQYWPPLGEWGGSATSGIGRFGSSSTAIRVSVGSPLTRTGSSYLFLRMRSNEATSSVDWLWRKLSGLTPGRSYTFSFYYKTPADAGAFIQSGNIRLGIVQNLADVATLASPLSGEVTFGHMPASTGVISSVDEHKLVSYSFTMPAGKTEVYVAWVRNGNQQPYIDDMSLVMNR